MPDWIFYSVLLGAGPVMALGLLAKVLWDRHREDVAAWERGHRRAADCANSRAVRAPLIAVRWGMTERTDKELLELAAKAAGYASLGYGELVGGSPCLHLVEADFTGMWAPLTDDGDALRLAVKLSMGLDILGFNQRVFAHAQGADGSVEEPHGLDPYAATRRAIVRAAAELGATSLQAEGGDSGGKGDGRD